MDEEFEQWKAQVKSIMLSMSQVYSDKMIKTIDWDAWKTEYYDEELSPYDAILEDIQAMKDSM